MEQGSFSKIIADQTKRALWEVKNVIDCVPDHIWNKAYCGMPLWKHIYHMLHSLDQWFINPRDESFREPSFHAEALNDLDVPSAKELTRGEIELYFARIKKKTEAYLHGLRDEKLLQMPEQCEYTRFTLIMAQHRHLHTHMGMLMGFIIAETGLWPRVLGLEGQFPAGQYDKYF